MIKNEIIELKNTMKIIVKSVYKTKTYSTKVMNFLTTVEKNQLEQIDDSMILVDNNDNKIGEISKIDGHLTERKNEFPHRAFSVFLFNDNLELLLQRRAVEKITFSNKWTNTCCSHPFPNKDEEEPDIGIKRAAVRRLRYELNIDYNLNNLFLVDKVLYRAREEESMFEEFEVDHVLIGYYDKKIHEINYNPTEISCIKYESIENIGKELNQNKKNYTPWFYNIMLEKSNHFNQTIKNLKSLSNIQMRQYEKNVKLREAKYTNI